MKLDIRKEIEAAIASGKISLCKPGRPRMTTPAKPSMASHVPLKSYKRKRPDDSAPPMGFWYICYTDAGAEKKACEAVRAGLMTYLPMMSVIRATGGRRGAHLAQKAVQERALFPRYFFVASKGNYFPFSALKPNPNDGSGVIDLIRCDGRAIPVPHQAVRDIMLREAEGLFDETAPRTTRQLEIETGFSTGGEAKIITGPFSGFTSKIKALMTNREAEIVLSLFGRNFQVRMPLDHLAKVD